MRPCERRRTAPRQPTTGTAALAIWATWADQYSVFPQSHRKIARGWGSYMPVVPHLGGNHLT